MARKKTVINFQCCITLVNSVLLLWVILKVMVFFILYLFEAEM